MVELKGYDPTLVKEAIMKHDKPFTVSNIVKACVGFLPSARAQDVKDSQSLGMAFSALYKHMPHMLPLMSLTQVRVIYVFGCFQPVL